MRWSGTDRPVLVVGYGNSLRRDDGAGLVLARELVDTWQEHGLPATLLAAHQLSPELAEDIAQSGAQLVLFVDAEESNEPAGAHIELVQLDTGYISPALGHHLTPAAVMVYARELYAYEGRAWLCAVPGTDFAHGEGLSEPTQAWVDAFLAQWKDIWQDLQAS